MRLFIFEHIVGGGALHRSLSGDGPAQGAAMLGAAVADFQRAGCEVVITRDARAEPVMGAATTFTLSPGEDVEAAFDRAATAADAALVIAPETRGRLLDWTRRLEGLEVASLGSRVEAIGLCADKLDLFEHLQRHGIPTPTTTLDADALPWPMIAKPRVGAGCAGVRVLPSAQDLATLEAAEPDDERVFQPRCAGRAVSVSLLVTDGRVRALPVGEQFVRGESVLRYEGGRLPLTGELGERAATLAVRAARTVAGLRGFVGVDLVLGPTASDDVVIEINPRLTLSYAILARVCTPGVAEAWLDESLEPRWAVEHAQGVRFDAAGRIAIESGEQP